MTNSLLTKAVIICPCEMTYGFMPNGAAPAIAIKSDNSPAVNVAITKFNAGENIAMQALCLIEKTLPQMTNYGLASYNNIIRRNVALAKDASDNCKDAMGRIAIILNAKRAKLARLDKLGKPAPKTKAIIADAENAEKAMQAEFALIRQNRLAINKAIKAKQKENEND